MKKRIMQRLEKFQQKFCSKLAAAFFVLSLSVFGGNTFASNAFSQITNISLNLSNVPIEVLFNEIERTTDYVILYKEEVIENKKVTIESSDQSLTEVLDMALTPLNLDYKVSGTQIVVTKSNKTAQSYETKQADFSVSGTIVDSSREPLIGASIVEKGNVQNATITNIDGQFKLKVSPGATLIISYIGYDTQELKASENMAIVLKETENMLQDVVVVGYGTQKKANLTGAVAQVGSDVLENRPISNVAQGLQGVLPNVNINVGSGAPGQSAKINIRGTGSINGGEPLVLVDNVQMDLNLINPSDIESISVLKDAASSAIYGARAAYGVILVTTKKGSKGQKPRVTLSAQGYWQSPQKKIETVNSMQYLKMLDTAYKNGGGSGRYYDANVYEYAEKYFNDPKNNLPVFIDPSKDASKYQYVGNTNWWDEIYKKTSFSQLYNVGVSGGSETSSYYVSMGLNNTAGILKAGNDEYKKYNLNINVSTDVTKWLNVSGKIMYNYSREQHPAGGVSAANEHAYAGISAYSGYLKNDLSPLMPVRHPDGHYAGQGGNTNPVAIQDLGGDVRTRINDVWATGAVKLTPIKDLIVNLDYTFNSYTKGAKTHVRQFMDYTAVPGTEKPYPWTSPSSVSMANDEDYYAAFNAFAEYNFNLVNSDHAFKVMGGYNQEYKHLKYFYAAQQGLIDNDNASINLASGEKFVGGNETRWTISGFFARINYNYKQRYLLEFNGRYDGSSKFTKDDRYDFFPSVSGAWRLSEEAFWNDLRNTWWNDMKIRASYGSLGNQALKKEDGNFPYLLNYPTENVGYLLGGKIPVGVSTPGLVSALLTWETVNQFNIGMDATFLRNRLTGSFDWYRRDTKDMLVAGQSLPAVLGTAVPKSNSADLKTTGYEISIAWNDRLSNGLSYWAKATLADSQSEITKYANEPGSLKDQEGNDQYYKGRKIGDIWGLVSKGLFQSDEEAANSPSQKDITNTEWAAGDVKFEDLDGNGIINRGNNTIYDPGDQKVIGNNEPRYQYGISAGFEYKGFDFSMLWQGIGKRDYSVGEWSSSFWGFTSQWDVPLKASLDYWTPENTGAYFPSPNWNNGGNRKNSDRYLLDASYIRLKSLSVGYNINPKIINKWGLSQLRVFVVGENLLTFTDLHDAFDPETLNNLTYPVTKKISLGINIAF